MESSETILKLRRHREVLREIAHVCADKTLADGLLGDVAAQVARAVEINHVKILRYRAEAGDLLVEAGVGWRAGVVGHATFSTDLASPPGSAFQTGQPVCISNLGESQEFRASRILLDHGIVSLLNVPLMIDGGTWGVMEVDSTVPRDFSVDTQDFLLTAGSVVGMALRRHQTSEAHRDALSQLAALNNKLDVLLNEMHHRVKNNFQGILSVITMARRNAREEAQDALTKVAESIVAMALAHDQLALSQSGNLDLANYLRTLATRIKKPIDTVTVEVNADAFDAPVDQAVPLGLIVNELITNSSKHAFDESGGALRVELTAAPQHGMLRLAVSDNGKGTDFSKSGGSGLKLIDALARQLRGRVERESSAQGTRTIVIFPAA